jgi:hypothetical protein
MSNTKALVVGVSNYYIAGAGNLPFVKNDVIEMEEALCSGLKLNTDDIITLGKKEDVKKEEFINSILQISGLLNKDDNFISECRQKASECALSDAFCHFYAFKCLE